MPQSVSEPGLFFEVFEMFEKGDEPYGVIRIDTRERDEEGRVHGIVESLHSSDDEAASAASKLAGVLT